jgi:hypothetical protein
VKSERALLFGNSFGLQNYYKKEEKLWKAQDALLAFDFYFLNLVLVIYLILWILLDTP